MISCFGYVFTVIDDLHSKNHIESCRQTWNPQMIRELYPNANLSCCEQTFAWLGRFKKILNMMGKVHHHFFLHCLVKRRNLYITRLYEEGRRSLLEIDKEYVEDNQVYISSFQLILIQFYSDKTVSDLIMIVLQASNVRPDKEW